MEKEKLLEEINAFDTWYHRAPLYDDVFTKGTCDVIRVLKKLDLPQDMSNLRILDIGTRDGFFAFECERRNAAEVIAIDYAPVELTGFSILKKWYGSAVEYIQDNIYNITPEKYGVFDIVLCLGVLYHLRIQ